MYEISAIGDLKYPIGDIIPNWEFSFVSPLLAFGKRPITCSLWEHSNTHNTILTYTLNDILFKWRPVLEYWHCTLPTWTIPFTALCILWEDPSKQAIWKIKYLKSCNNLLIWTRTFLKHNGIMLLELYSCMFSQKYLPHNSRIPTFQSLQPFSPSHSHTVGRGGGSVYRLRFRNG